MFFSYKKRTSSNFVKTPVNPYLGACLFFGIALSIAAYTAFHWHVPGRLFPFIEGSLIVASSIFGIACFHLARKRSADPTSDFSSGASQMLVAIPTCLVLLGIMINSQTQAIGWQDGRAAVTSISSYKKGIRNTRRIYTVHYQYVWNAQVFSGSTREANSRLTGEPSITTRTTNSIGLQPLVAGDPLVIKVNPAHPQESLVVPKFPIAGLIAFLIFGLLGLSGFRDWRAPKDRPKRTYQFEL